MEVSSAPRPASTPPAKVKPVEQQKKQETKPERTASTEAPKPQATKPEPVINTQGHTTGRIVNTTA